jgi:TonB family protein
MFKLIAPLVLSATAIITATAPSFASESMTLRSMLVADIGHDVVAISKSEQTDAKIVNSVPADMPAFEQLAHIGGTATIEVDLDAKGTVTNAAVFASSGHTRIDQSALSAVRMSTYQAATINGRAVGGSYLVEVIFDPSN